MRVYDSEGSAKQRLPFIREDLSVSSEITQDDQDREGWGAFWPAGLMLISGLSGLVLATLFSQGVAGQYVVVGAPFGRPAAEVITRADGAIVAAGGFDNVMIAASDRPGFAADLRRSGALIVFPAPAFLGCSSPSETGV